MALNQLPSIPTPPKAKSIEELNTYIGQLYASLSKWQTVFASTGFLGTIGTDSGHLFFKSTSPTSTEGDDGDVWVQYLD